MGLLREEQQGLYKSMTLVALAAVLSRVLGFFREMAIAYRFGATMETDAYLVAILLPTILFYAFSDALKNTFITVFTSFKKEESAASFVNTLALYLAAVLFILVVLAVIFAPQVVYLLAPGFKGEVFTLTVGLTRILVPGIFFMGLAGLATGFLHSHHRFFIPALVNVPHNSIVIISALYLGLRYGVVGLAWGSLLAVASQLLIQVPSLCRTTFKLRPGLSLRHPGIQRVFVLLPAIVLSSAVLELKHLLDRLFASFLAPGSIAALNYAERIYVLPQGIFASAVIIVLYPTLVELLAEKDMDAFTAQIKRGVSLLFFVLLPVTAGLIILRRPLVEFLFQRGAFDASATELTTYALLFYTPGLVGFALHYFCNRIYFALQEVRTLAFVNLAMVVSNAVFNFLLMPLLGHGGIALGTSLAFTLGSLWLFVIFTQRLQLSFLDLLLRPFYRSALAAVLMSAFLYLFLFLWTEIMGQSFAGLKIIMMSSALGAAVYFCSSLLLRIPEAAEISRFLKGLIKKTLAMRA
ncbi:MAG: murein biosynthesis integral membrane protein MurJ [Bacillota bacterium]|nr:murein biosynthesis integral membrane protein MurJ [Bacillota bacterium]